MRCEGRTPPARMRRSPNQGKGGARADLNGKRILLVEDELILALEIEHVLEDAGAEVVGPAASLGDALRLARELPERVDAAILDVDLHGQAVFPVADVLQRRSVPFLFHTGHGTKAELSARYADVVVCPKPVIADHLVAVIADLLE